MMAIPAIMGIAGLVSTGVSLIKMFTAPSMPSAPSAADESRQALEAAYAQSELMKKRRGAASTILTGPQGVMDLGKTRQDTLGG